MDKSLIIKEIMKIYNFRKYGDFADFLGVNQQVLSNWVKRNTFDLELIYTKCDKISPDYLITGTGEILRGNQESQQSTNDIATFMQSKNVFKEIFERLEKIEEVQDSLVISQSVNADITTIIENKQNQVLENK